MGTRDLNSNTFTADVIDPFFAVEMNFAAITLYKDINNGDVCKIYELGNSPWDSVGGSASASVGDEFTANADGSGSTTGKALVDTPVYVWNGVGDLTVNSKTYTGLGDFLHIESIEETAEVRSTGLTLSLSGIDSSANSLLTKALTYPYQGRVCTVHVGLRSAASSMFEVFSGYMDQLTISESPESSSIQLSVENKLVALEKAANTRYTLATQKSLYPDDFAGSNNDLGFAYVQGLKARKIVWGGVPEDA